MSSLPPLGWSVKSGQGLKMTRHSVSPSSSSSSVVSPTSKNYDMPAHCMARNSVKALQALHHDLAKSLSACTTWAAEGNVGLISTELATMRPQLTDAFNEMHMKMENVVRASHNVHNKNVLLSKEVLDLKARLASANEELKQYREKEEDVQLSQVAQNVENNQIGFSAAVRFVDSADSKEEREGDEDPGMIPSTPQLTSPKSTQ